MSLAAPLTLLENLDSQLAEHGFAVLAPAEVARLVGGPLDDLQRWAGDWADLPPDNYLKDGGRYRRRRHASYVLDAGEVRLAPHRAHWQPVEYNALHGGMERWFEPMTPAVTATPAWPLLLRGLARHASRLKGEQPWYLEAHQFRIDTAGGIGRPTPEGAHRDGVDLVAVFLVARHGIKGGETRIFEAEGPAGLRFTLAEPWSLLLLDDERVIHETTPIQPLGKEGGYRDTLVVTLRSGGFQGPGR
ncbi:2OG-Fe dioxygenase family protein [Ramlibacter sp. AW1]|uniref:2OG-Fe dioxygenase family protein n=1 Tax=Ramlibacter aurantiacus TaxID=2801330 RepID=A0A936ZSV5_9BURK|nr:2OG-Fe dioxygenase family protein [Ramlibacter aurantiacus]MBL0419999.1 2OG-Fe dioxygenase family protein [Ramlibacter aurantiacus]